jgi:hypothetical protein
MEKTRQSPLPRNFDATVRLLSPGIGSPRGIVFSAFSAVTDMPIATIPGHDDNRNNFSMDPRAAYFAFFAPCHPILPSFKLTEQLIYENGLHQLDLVIRYIGSFYLKSSSVQTLRDSIYDSLLRNGASKDVFSVQSLLIFAIGSHANHEEEISAQALSLAISIALEIRMNDAEFAVRAACGSKILEESFRRTWWELYVMNALFSGINKDVNFQLQYVQSDVPLPCEEVDFASEVRCICFNDIIN